MHTKMNYLTVSYSAGRDALTNVNFVGREELVHKHLQEGRPIIRNIYRKVDQLSDLQLLMINNKACTQKRIT
jgi:hypothetical protein